MRQRNSEEWSLRSMNVEIATAGQLSAKDSPELRAIISMESDTSGESSFSVHPSAICANVLRIVILSSSLFLRLFTEHEIPARDARTTASNGLPLFASALPRDVPI
ncbi:hypothetical protein ACS0PU_011125 [Formica fusca]